LFNENRGFRVYQQSNNKVAVSIEKYYMALASLDNLVQNVKQNEQESFMEYKCLDIELFNIDEVLVIDP